MMIIQRNKHEGMKTDRFFLKKLECLQTHHLHNMVAARSVLIILRSASE